MNKFQIFTDSSSDLTTEMRKEYGIEYFRMAFTVNGKELPADLDFKEYSSDQLYEWIRDDNTDIKTSLISVPEMITRMKPYLDKGLDILYIACTSVLSGSFNIFRLAAEELQSQYPNQRMEVVDSHRAGMTLGLMVMDAVKEQQAGKSLDDVVDWVKENMQKYNLCGTLETLKYLKNAGRVSGGAAFFANLLGIKPIIIADTLGHNYAISKVKGTKKSWTTLFDIVKDAVEGQENPTIYVGQGVAQDASNYFIKRFKEELNANIVEYTVGPIIGISCGPGVIHLVCKGKEVTITSPEK